MPKAPQNSNPGVFVEQIPNGVQEITPADTATTAFIGRAERAPVNEPVVINSFGDFETLFGGLWVKSRLGHAASDFYLNGGEKAVIVRVFNASGTTGHSTIRVGGDEAILLQSKDPGQWGNQLRVRVEDVDVLAGQDIAEHHGTDSVDPKLAFNLFVHDRSTGVTEVFPNVTAIDGTRRVDRIVNHESKLVEVTTITGRPEAHDDPPSLDGELWEKPGCFSAVEKAEEARATDGDTIRPTDIIGDNQSKTGIYALDKTDIFNVLCIPPYDPDTDVKKDVWSEANEFCVLRRAMLLVDPPKAWDTKDKAKAGFPTDVLPSQSENAALYFPRIKKANPLRDNLIEEFVPCGVIAGLYARTDARRGVWKSPAGMEAGLRGVRELSVSLTDTENGELNPRGINCLRTIPTAGHVAWGARTMRGDDRLADQFKYVSVRRTALFIEESLYRGTQWAVFEPNDESLWSQLRLAIGAFMDDLFRQGAFQGNSPREAYFVNCGPETTTQIDINRGVVNIQVGFAPLRPAEFVVISIQQIAGEIAP